MVLCNNEAFRHSVISLLQPSSRIRCRPVVAQTAQYSIPSSSSGVVARMTTLPVKTSCEMASIASSLLMSAYAGLDPHSRAFLKGAPVQTLSRLYSTT